jgi:hypothetical protein
LVKGGRGSQTVNSSPGARRGHCDPRADRCRAESFREVAQDRNIEEEFTTCHGVCSSRQTQMNSSMPRGLLRVLSEGFRDLDHVLRQYEILRPLVPTTLWPSRRARRDARGGGGGWSTGAARRNLARAPGCEVIFRTPTGKPAQAFCKSTVRSSGMVS